MEEWYSYLTVDNACIGGFAEVVEFTGIAITCGEGDDTCIVGMAITAGGVLTFRNDGPVSTTGGGSI